MKTRKPLVDVCNLLFRQIPEPRNLQQCKAINVYGNKYRINLYTTTNDPIHNITKTRITQSYFCSLDGDDLRIVSPKI